MMRNRILSLTIVLFVLSCSSPEGIHSIEIWSDFTIDFQGPEAAETGEINPFLDYRLQVQFEHATSGKRYSVPGYFAADGSAAESSASTGNVWRVHFRPDELGNWTYIVSFVEGKEIAVSEDLNAGTPAAFHGEKGKFKVIESSNQEGPFQARGKLRYVGQRYLQFAGDQSYYLKAGADSPENFLAYYEFDGTTSLKAAGQIRSGEAPTANLHQYQSHVQDWQEGDPLWQDTKGKGILGALNYLAGKGMNNVYFLTMNVEGDGQDVWPWIDADERLRYDCSKLDQWNIVFNHMDRLGIMLHIVTQETENEKLLNDGKLGTERKLYYRELIARFAHHLAVSWNLGEENGVADFSPNGQTDQDRKDMATYFKQHDPYQNYVAVHTHAVPKFRDPILEAVLGYKDLDGPSLQIHRPEEVHGVTLKWRKASDQTDKTWVTFLDEIGPHTKGVMPDEFDPQHDTIRKQALWGNLMAGGAGAEWYFGYKYPHTDLNLEDWRSRENMWNQTRLAVEFFQKQLPFHEMMPMDELVGPEGNWCMAKSGEVYAIYLPEGGLVEIDLRATSNTFQLSWFRPVGEGQFLQGKRIQGGSIIQLGNPPSEQDQDWLAVLKKTEPIKFPE